MANYFEDDVRIVIAPRMAVGPQGANAPEMQIQYSADSSSWHNTYQAGDLYIRFSTDGGNTWSDAMDVSSPNAQDILTKLKSVDGFDSGLDADYVRGNIPVRVVSTISELIGLSDYDDGETVLVLGYHTAGDGGGGIFRWDANEDKANHNGGTVIDPDAAFPTDWSDTGQQTTWFTAGTGSGCWKRVYSGKVYVEWFGAKGNGITDDSIPIQKCCDLQGHIILHKTYLCKNVYLSSNTTIDGLGTGRVINSDGNACLLVLPPTQNTQYADIKIVNLSFDGQVSTLGFSEHKHLLSISGGKNCEIHNCRFEGYRGDGIYLGSGIAGGEEYHNENITITNCIFDGINQDNRNGISIIDGTSIKIQKCIFKNSTRSDMPGAIDIEPNSDVSIVRSISILHNDFDNIGGNVGAISFALNNVTLNTPYGLYVVGNNIGLNGTILSTGVTIVNPNNYNEQMGIIIKDNVIYTDKRGINIYGSSSSGYLNGINIQGNIIRQKYASIIGYQDYDVVYNITILGNIVESTGTEHGFSFKEVHGATISNNIFTGTDSSAYDIRFAGGGDSINIINNKFSSTAAFSVYSTTVDGSSCLYYGNCGNRPYWPAYRTDECGGKVQAFDSSTLPDSFPEGISIAVINGDSGVPDTGGRQGTLITYRLTMTGGYEKWTYQLYYHANNTVDVGCMYIRRRNSSSNSWTSWYKISGA